MLLFFSFIPRNLRPYKVHVKAYMAGHACSVWNKSMNHDTYYVIIKLKAFKDGFV